MYSDRENVNILTALLVAHGVHHAVVCPGSRNAPIVHNLNEVPEIDCHPVTDERSACFYAMGIAQCIGEPVAVCVTSGSALLNLLPGVAEAFYQHVPLVVISADRPIQWINQLDGQTIPQADALGRFVNKAVTLPEPHDDEERWYCNRLVNEALMELFPTVNDAYGAPVHINVPISEPLYQFTKPALPDVRKIEKLQGDAYPHGCVEEVVDAFSNAKRPMIVVGQLSPYEWFCDEEMENLSKHVLVLQETLSPPMGEHYADRLLDALSDDENYLPDFVIYIGGCLVSKGFRRLLRKANEAEVWLFSPTGVLSDPTMRAKGVIAGDLNTLISALFREFEHKETTPFYARWKDELKKASGRIQCYEPAYSQMAAVKYFEDALRQRVEKADFDLSHYNHFPPQTTTFYANSSAIRLANIYANRLVYCNRGVNGIEGSLSTACGYSLVSDDDMVFCVVGDLSFFYDSNALWNSELRGNLRILLLNNGGGGIFEKFEGLGNSPASDYIKARHQTSSKGICQSYRVDYREAHDAEEMKNGIEWLTAQCHDDGRPRLLEVFTSPREDALAMENLLNT
ncbi:MAG: 2-succinyl-5-enolpyruvyl-6-hydroxy-3-cyclohexene-1-carboxylic-acid synthase [Prevotella sp.]|nr:2-succinyl-5-enolpyruvyl-6-hydroxy-3-cyclohexene-1-carboxylic-acid synthase [Prevotella sp.]